ncbi:hypothetical protein NVP1084O_184 [Vibrio phage 1.084.O._10N.261.49.F5]|nr:hypothetical protein NVP1084O_184 [Vibrio phage 1.084.O._10N.261.49.F5]
MNFLKWLYIKLNFLRKPSFSVGDKVIWYENHEFNGEHYDNHLIYTILSVSDNKKSYKMEYRIGKYSDVRVEDVKQVDTFYKIVDTNTDS